MVEAFDEAGNSIVGSFSFDIASFEKPIFTDYPSRLSTDVVPVITGSTRPRSDVHLFVTRINTGDQKTEYVIKSDDSGKFIFIPDGPFAEGVIELSAYSVDEYGAQSDSSESIRIVVAPPGYIQFGSMLVSALSLFVPLVALLLLLVLSTLYLVRRIRSIGGYVVRETKEAEETIVTSFAKIKDVLDTNAKTLASSRKSKQLTKAESELVESVRNELIEAEKKVKKEVSDVDDIV